MEHGNTTINITRTASLRHRRSQFVTNKYGLGNGMGDMRIRFLGNNWNNERLGDNWLMEGMMVNWLVKHLHFLSG